MRAKTAPPANHTITVMPDYGMGPYAWQKPNTDDSTYVGICIATATDGFEAEDGTKISGTLESEFNEWTAKFEQFADRPGFDWEAFHSQGLKLSRQLKHELGPNYKVLYHKPCEDPNRETQEYTEITQ